MYHGVSVLDFDHSYQWQAFLRHPSVEWIDLADLAGTKRYCAPESLAEIQRRLRWRRARGVTLIGSGNYHYVTYLLLSEIKTPFSLVLFDYHTDMMESCDESLVSCGSWLSKALRELPLLRQAFIIGARPGVAETIPPELKRKVLIFEQAVAEDAGVVIPAFMSRLVTPNVYISIDKDVLDPQEAITDWDQGAMKLTVVVGWIRYIIHHRRLCGADICGEYPVSPVEIYSREGRLIVGKNARANRVLLDVLCGTDTRTLPMSS